MYVGLKMMTEVATVTPNTSLKDAHDLMEKKMLWMLPVVEGKKLVGYVKKEDVRAALPSPATMLSKHEIPSIIEKITLKDLVQKDIVTVRPETDIETAAEIMSNEQQQGLAVVDAEGRLAGYIDRTIMLEVLVEEMGLRRGGKRFAIEFTDRPGVMAEVSNIISEMGINFVSAASFYHKNSCILVFRVETDDLSPIVEALKERKFNIVGPEHFAAEWS